MTADGHFAVSATDFLQNNRALLKFPGLRSEKTIALYQNDFE